jgi:hypothetical protein
MASVGACPERAQRVEGSRITLVNVIESIGLTSFPGSVGGFFVVSWWRAQTGDHQMLQRAEMRDPGNNTVFRIDTPFAFLPNQQSMRVLNVSPTSNLQGPR